MTETERRIMRVLLLARGQTVTYQALLERVWNITTEARVEYHEAHLVRVNVARVRPKLDPPLRIETHRGVGYRLVQVVA